MYTYIYVRESCLVKISGIHCQDTGFGEETSGSVVEILPSSLLLASSLTQCSMSPLKS